MNLLFLSFILGARAFTFDRPPLSSLSSPRTRTARIFDSTTALDNDVSRVEAIAEAKGRIEDSLAGTDKGRSASDSEREEIKSLLRELEDLCTLSEVRVCIAKQVIDVPGGKYRNELYVGGSGADGDEDAWLTAVLDASWSEWDGKFLDSGTGDVSASDGVDYGATTWKVDFETLQISAFGIPLFTQKFKAGTARTWKMTYLDDETRIVRAGKTGRPDDDVIFYMIRGST
ncbi:hypothetical protein THAOC_10509 [Thalassiosira oceanica]|uniref:Plastid lipid-associated protein/fibrillin conserved domain-containing protein n=1 Tax=Thalassiosira oceanica TaxID=159749 RepID=K0TCV2_THAOC|nr:hypothetical protein THAOC_10509 [Thalassiosira oceanica]|eukprot:EJK68322.1 hypothetical protein THAOC_10509 [Thalassiosira oceanica]